jgi:hypothetical protein
LAEVLTVSPAGYMACHVCRPHYRERTHLSLNATANGDISPSAAIGYGFRQLGKRPVVDSDVVKDLGLLPVPSVSARWLFFSKMIANHGFSLKRD